MSFYPFVVVLHFALCIFLMLIILLQPGKGGDVGAAFGGGSSTSFFGPRGPATLLSQSTTVVAVLFMVTSFSLSLMSKRDVGGTGDAEDEVQQLEQEKLDRSVIDAGLPPEQPTVIEPATESQ